MTNKEIAERLDNMLDEKVGSFRLGDEIMKLRDELDPPRPDPGTVVWFPFDKSYGIVSPDGRGVHNQNGELLAWWEVEKGTTPARILAPGEVAVKVPPVSEWPEGAKELASLWLDNGRNELFTGANPEWSITRAEAERMEAER